MKRIALLLTLLSGCSWVFVSPVPVSYDDRTPPECDTGMAPVVLDILATAFDAASIAALNLGDVSQGDRIAGIIGASASGIAFLLSAITGVRWTDECRRARQSHSRYLIDGT